MQDLNESHVGESAAELGHGKGKEPMELHASPSVEGVLFVVVRELWQEKNGFEIWEVKVEEEDIQDGVLSEAVMLSKVQGRKWVHESSLMVPGQKKARPEDLPDKVSSPATLAMAGQRRFAPRQGRSGNFEMFEPSCSGDTWLKVDGEEIELFRDTMSKCDRVSFVFKNQVELVAQAYSLTRDDQ